MKQWYGLHEWNGKINYKSISLILSFYILQKCAMESFEEAIKMFVNFLFCIWKNKLELRELKAYINSSFDHCHLSAWHWC